MTPRIILAADAAARAQVRADLIAEGAHVVDGLELPAEPWDLTSRRLVCDAHLDPGAVEPALLAATRGAGLLLTVAQDDPLSQAAVVDQLSRVGRVERAQAAPEDGALSDEEIALLESLAVGRSIREAADETYVSLRTANRRLANARRVLGVSSNREAVMAYLATRNQT